MTLQDLRSQAAGFHRTGQLADAERLYRQVLDAAPADFAANHLLGLLCAQQGRKIEALALIAAALQANPGSAAARTNYGNVLLEMRRPAEALVQFDQALAIRPDDAIAQYNRANALQVLGRPDLALNAFDRVLALQPDHVEALCHRADLLQTMRRFDEALAQYDRALSLAPAMASALHGRGVLRWAGRQMYRPALQDMEQALACDPGLELAPGDLLHLRMHGGDWRDLDAQIARIDAGVRAGRRLTRPFAYLGFSQSPADLQACARLEAANLPAPSAWPQRPRRDGKIRIGYLCGEFREHATAYLAAGLFERHDRARFHITAFDTGWSDNSPTRKRLESAFDGFVGIAEMPDLAAAERIHQDGIDILVNLNGYCGVPRMGVFARRPAPVQVNYLGFPGTLGSEAIDYIVADRTVIPDDEQKFYTEKVVTLPNTYQVTDASRPRAHSPPSRAALGLPDTGFVFCSFNQSYKLTPGMFAVWMRILKRVPGSVLWLLRNIPEFPDAIRRQAEAQGVEATRLVFAPPCPPPEHLARLAVADLCLDTLPYNGHTTTSDALWAGVPLVTCRGDGFAGRVAASLLQAIALPELVTDSLSAYEALAVALAQDPTRRAALREKLARNRLTTPLFDTDRFRRNLEAAYVRMWEIAQRNDAPRSFHVEGPD